MLANKRGGGREGEEDDVDIHGAGKDRRFLGISERWPGLNDRAILLEGFEGTKEGYLFDEGRTWN